MITLPITFTPPGKIQGASWDEVAPFYPSGDSIRQIERASIRTFMEKQRHMLHGCVVDFGAGKQPYRDLVVGEYVPIEQGDLLPTQLVDAVMCNQVLQYSDVPARTLREIGGLLRPGGALVMTYPTNWDEVEAEDYWRFTASGMERLLKEAGFSILNHEQRAAVVIGHFKFPLGYGIVARKN